MCLSAIASLLNGRIGAAVGASFDATGRLHDVTNDVTRLMRLLLSVYHGQTHVQVALNDLAQGVGAPSVTAAVSERVVQLLQPVLTSYPDRLWAPTCSRQALLEHTLALVDAGTLAGACPLLLPVFQRFLDADLGPRKALGVARWVPHCAKHAAHASRCTCALHMRCSVHGQTAGLAPRTSPACMFGVCPFRVVWCCQPVQDFAGCLGSLRHAPCVQSVAEGEWEGRNDAAPHRMGRLGSRFG